MSERPRMSVLRFRQLSTGRFYVPRDEVDERRDVRERRQPTARALQLTACPVAGPRSAPGTPPPRGGGALGRAPPGRRRGRRRRRGGSSRRRTHRAPASARRPRGRTAPGPRAAATPRPRPEILELPPGRRGARTWRGASADPRPHTSAREPDPLLLRRGLPVLVHGVPCRRGGRGRGPARGRVASLRAAPGAEAAPRGSRRPSPHRLDEHVYRRALAAGDRDPPAPLPAPLDAHPRRVPVGR